MPTPLEVIILAAGQGKRMYSALPKVLHPLAGKALLGHVFDAARQLSPRALHVVYGHGGDQVRAVFADQKVTWVLQAEQLGTGHAVQQAIDGVGDTQALILYGDVPLIRPETLQTLMSLTGPNKLALLTAQMENPHGYGRVLRDAAGKVVRIVEQKDATPQEAQVREVNTGILIAPAARLKKWLAQLRNNNAQREYYLTDVIAMAVADGVDIVTHQPSAAWEVFGVNSKRELAALERIHQQNVAQSLLERGVTLHDPARIDIRGELTCGRDVVIDVNVVFEGKVTLADGVHIGPNNVIRDTAIGARTEIQPNCVIDDVRIGADCRIGPFARIRPGTTIADHAHVGNFVEIKKSDIGVASKVNHLSYVGDSTLGRDVNVGAGTITCNYDGANKSRTVIGDNAFIGSNSALVAPITIGAGATIGAGSVITKDAPAGELTLARGEQKTIKGWQRPVKVQKR